MKKEICYLLQKADTGSNEIAEKKRTSDKARVSCCHHYRGDGAHGERVARDCEEPFSLIIRNIVLFPLYSTI